MLRAISQVERVFILYCPFRGCAGDWVKLGVAKRHGAVLGDAVSKMADENTKVWIAFLFFRLTSGKILHFSVVSV